MKFERLQQFVREEAAEIVRDNPEIKPQIFQLLNRFRARFRGRNIDRYSQIFEMCNDFDNTPNIVHAVPDEIRETIEHARRRLQRTLIEALNEEQKMGLFGKIDLVQEHNRQMELAKITGRIISVIREKGPEQFDQYWLKEHAPDDFKTILTLQTGRITSTQLWEEFKEMLPNDLQQKFEIQKNVSIDEEILNAVEQYGDLAKKLGPDVVAEFLISIGKIDEGNFGRAIKIIPQYLGQFKMVYLGYDDILEVPEAMLRMTDVRQLLLVKLRNYVYRELTKGGEFALGSIHKIHLEGLREEVRLSLERLEQKMEKALPAHRELFEESLDYYDEVLSIKAPDRMVPILEAPDGERFFFPSLRQKIAMKEIKDHKRKLITFFMGQGKTGAALLAKEYVGAKKMLYTCPPGKLVHEIKDRIENKYYKKGKSPKVGVIEPGMDKEKLAKVLSCEVVIFPYSMFSSSVEGKPIVDYVKRRHFDFMVVDEVQFARKIGTQDEGEGRNTRVVYELATKIPGLYKNGYIVSLSADPTPNTPNDITPQLRLYDKDTYGDVSTLGGAIRGGIHPLRIRNALTHYMLLLDPPEDWEKYVKVEPVQLYDEERAIYNAVLANDDLTATQKLNLLYLCALNPHLFSPNQEIKSAVFDTVAQKLEEYLEDYDTVVVAENSFKQGITREHSEHTGSSIAQKIRAHFKDKAVIVHVIDGNTSEKQRQRIFSSTKRNDGKKRIVIANGMLFGLESVYPTFHDVSF